MTDPPEVFTYPPVLCPSCGHGIDPHGLDPGGRCGVGTWDAQTQTNELCFCMWSPNDVAAKLIDAAHDDEKHKGDLAIQFWELEVEGLRAKLNAARDLMAVQSTTLTTALEQVALAEEVTTRLVSVIARQEKALTEWEDMKQWFDTWSKAAERDGSYRTDMPLYLDVLRLVDELVRLLEAERDATRLEVEAAVAKASGLIRIENIAPLHDLDYGPVETVRFVDAPEDGDV